MTIAQALVLVRRVGTVAEAGGKLKLAFPERMRPSLAQAIEALKANKAEALAQVAQLPPEELVEPAWTDWAERKAASLNRLNTWAATRCGSASCAAGRRSRRRRSCWPDIVPNRATL